MAIKMNSMQESEPITANEDEQAALVAIERALVDTVNVHGAVLAKLLGPHGEQIELPSSVTHALTAVVHYLAHGRAISLAPLGKNLTTQQAADLLNVSRPYLIKLLESGQIPYGKTGTHRRILLDDVLAYKQRLDSERRHGLAELAQLSQEFGEDD